MVISHSNYLPDNLSLPGSQSGDNLACQGGLPDEFGYIYFGLPGVMLEDEMFISAEPDRNS